ncbi:xanthine dehydrogenase family protein molybdopterin-binding subunit [Limnohabitans sp. Rim11]|uniref:xanthine dehydrogenase family protein molybdopterin-binding subunit n=1 Tax=Limnohabitans sp. Rim11 TaxID=1100719 RepID=UPI000AA39368|nr:xanthine dehydrogenase family protein molybdopterin-binding subunit [Limnohabitans sp. Rim11]
MSDNTIQAIPEQTTRFGSGNAVKRVEDQLLLLGSGTYANDVSLPGQTHLVFLRSPYPHAKITSIDTQAAKAMPGVHGVLTGQDLLAAGLKPMARPMNFKRADGSPLSSTTRFILATDTVRFVGEPIVAVVADTEEQAKNAAEAIQIDFEPLASATLLSDALAPSAPLLTEAPDNRVAETRYGDAAATQRAFDQAAHVVHLNIVNQRLAALSIEPRSVLAYVDNGRLTIRLSSQMPTGVRTAVCDVIGLNKENVRVIVGDVGGGFGMKTGAYAEDLVTAYCAHKLGRPVKWIADRNEEFLSSSHGRDIETQASMALAQDGKILGLRIETLANVGAYPTMTGLAIQMLIGPWVQSSVYDIQTIDYHFTGVLTNTASTGAYRGAGRPEAIYNIERLMDEAARVSGIDRIELRRKNFVTPSQMPYKNPMGQVYDVGAFEMIMDEALQKADWKGFAQREASSKAKGLWRGLGVATFLEWTGGNALEENVQVQILADGMIEVASAVNAMGQGIATSLAQLVVDVFGVDISQVRVILGDTDRANGFGSAGSRSLFTGGSAMRVGAEKTLDKARELAGQALEASPADLAYQSGSFSVKGTDLKISLAELAKRQPDARIEIQSSTTASGPTWPNGCHICEVEVNPSTGETQVVSYTSVNDIGRVVNPMIVEGQLDGGAVQGMGQALLEALVYDAESGQLVTGSLMDYAAPRADIMPQMFKTYTNQSVPSTNNVLGVKGVGELGTIGATPCVVNAIADALARNGQADKAPQLQMPLTPYKLWEQMQAN